VASTESGTSQEQRPIFVRKATGLVKGWSAFDVFIYSALVVSPVTFGFFVFSLAPFFPNGSLLWAVVASCVFILFEVIVYATLIAAIPRAGGDYVWQSRILHGSIGFIMPAVAWWFILWHFAPIEANILVLEVFAPLALIAGLPGVAEWFAGSDGIFVSCVIVCAAASFYILLGLRGYSRIQRVLFYAGVVGIVIVIGLLLFSSKESFIAAYDREAVDLFGAGPGAYQATLEAGGYSTPSVTHFDFAGIFLLIPLLLFWNLYPNWGAALSGEVRGAKDFRKNVYAMGGALLFMAGVACVLFLLISKTMGWDFYNAANNAYWGPIYGYGEGGPVGAWPYPITMASWLIDSAVVQFVVTALVGLWFVAFLGSTFLSSTRVIFAAAFDRVLPEWAARLSSRRAVPVGALLLMVIPSLIVSALYAYTDDFATYTLDAVLVIAASYLVTSVAAAVMPWRMRRVYEASSVANWRIAGVPVLSLCALVFGGFLVYAMIYWLQDDLYGVNNKSSLIYIGCLYALAVTIYVVARVMRAREGISLDSVHHEIPVE
jgi:amino acid transporter